MTSDLMLTKQECFNLALKVENYKFAGVENSWDQYDGSINEFQIRILIRDEGFFKNKIIAHIYVYAGEKGNMCIGKGDCENEQACLLEDTTEKQINKPIEEAKQNAVKKAREMLGG